MKFEVLPRMSAGRVVLDVVASDGERTATIASPTCDLNGSAYQGAHELREALADALSTAYELGTMAAFAPPPPPTQPEGPKGATEDVTVEAPAPAPTPEGAAT